MVYQLFSDLNPDALIDPGDKYYFIYESLLGFNDLDHLPLFSRTEDHIEHTLLYRLASVICSIPDYSVLACDLVRINHWPDLLSQDIVNFTFNRCIPEKMVLNGNLIPERIRKYPDLVQYSGSYDLAGDGGTVNGVVLTGNDRYRFLSLDSGTKEGSG